MTMDKSTSPYPNPVLARFSLNEQGRDFVVGDIHGMFRDLQALLDQVEFDPERDRLFSVGDLVDRGPGSVEALDWLARPWFHACRGNHEQFAIDSTEEGALEFWVKYNGGEWWTELTPEEQQTFRDAFLSMPLVMEVETHTGIIGIVHADVPPLLTWDRFVELLENGHSEVMLYALFSRDRVHGMRGRRRVDGRAERIYCGHTPVREPVRIDNIYYIDTGACYTYDGYEDARLTMVEIHPESHQEFQIRVAPKR